MSAEEGVPSGWFMSAKWRVPGIVAVLVKKFRKVALLLEGVDRAEEPRWFHTHDV